MKTYLIFLILAVFLLANTNKPVPSNNAYNLQVSQNVYNQIIVTFNIDLNGTSFFDDATYSLNGGSYSSFSWSLTDISTYTKLITATLAPSNINYGGSNTLNISVDIYDSSTPGGGGEKPDGGAENYFGLQTFTLSKIFTAMAPIFPLDLSFSSQPANGISIDAEADYNFTVNPTYGVTYYKFKVNAGAWSSAYSIATVASKVMLQAPGASSSGLQTVSIIGGKHATDANQWMAVANAKTYSFTLTAYPSNLTVNFTPSSGSTINAKDDYQFTVSNAYYATHYKFKINSGAWSDIFPIATVATKATLKSYGIDGVGAYTISVLGGKHATDPTRWMAEANAKVFNFNIKVVNSVETFNFSNPLAGSTSQSSIDATVTSIASRQSIQRSISYSDAMGRTLQSNAVKASSAGKDIISHTEYDARGIESKKFLPYVSVNSDGLLDVNSSLNQKNFYAGSGYDNARKIVLTNYPWGESLIETSPAARVLEQGFIGQAWQLGAGTKKKLYRNNNANEVRLFDNLGVSTNYYNAGSLFMESTIDENGNVITEYKDLAGKVILKESFNLEYVRTYYVYDTNANLKYTIPPMAVKAMTASNVWDINQNNIKNLWVTCFVYDDENRLITKITPEAGSVYTAYDNLGRAILTQDENLRTHSQWLFTKYDLFGRIIYTGLVFLDKTRDQIQAELKDESVYFENRVLYAADPSNALYTVDATNKVGYTTNNAYPHGTLENTLLSINYYDDYNNPVSKNASYTTPIYSQAIFQRLKGKVTGTKIRLLTESILALSGTLTYAASQKVTNSMSIEILPETVISTTGEAKAEFEILEIAPKFLSSYNLYDKYSRVIFTESENTVGGKDVSQTQYDWFGKVIQNLQTHYVNGNTSQLSSILTEPRYDQLNRNSYSKVTRTIYNSPSSVINIYVPSLNVYNELNDIYCTYYDLQESSIILDINGIYQLSASPTYVYKEERLNNERGWVNEIKATTQNSTLLFNERLAYNTNLVGGQATAFTAQLNGNISAIEYTQKNDASMQKYLYNYGYDKLNQLKAEKYFALTNAGANDDYTNDNYNYDLNGNILSLKRNKLANTILDNLTYTYSGNKLTSVTDGQLASDATDGTYGFRDGNLSGADYLYDANGNMIEDKNKGIKIKYNYLNLPTEIIKTNGDKIIYKYTASGAKYQRLYTTAAGVISNNYLDAGTYRYEDNTTNSIEDPTLDNISHESGRFKKLSTVWVKEYFVNDHLGNTRVTFKQNPSLDMVESKHYYAFGLTIQALSNAAGPDDDNRFTYNGKEIDKDLNWYHYGARFYDPQLGRWFNLDGAGQFFSPYDYCGNSPIVHIDPDGNMGTPITGALIAATIELIFQVAFEDKIDWIDVGKEAAFGAVTLGASVYFNKFSRAVAPIILDCVVDEVYNSFKEKRDVNFDNILNKAVQNLVVGKVLDRIGVNTDRLLSKIEGLKDEFKSTVTDIIPKLKNSNSTSARIKINDRKIDLNWKMDVKKVQLFTEAAIDKGVNQVYEAIQPLPLINIVD